MRTGRRRWCSSPAASATPSARGRCWRRARPPPPRCSPPRTSARGSPAPDELAVGERILAQLPFGSLLYARIDLIRGADGAPCLLELELTEPSLFFSHAAGSAARYAHAALARLSRP